MLITIVTAWGKRVKTGGQAAPRCFIKEKFSLKILQQLWLPWMDSANIKANLDNTVETVWYQYPLAVRSVLCTFSDPNVIDLQPWNEVYLCALHLLCICSASALHLLCISRHSPGLDLASGPDSCHCHIPHHLSNLIVSMNLVSVSIFNNIKEYVSIMSRFYESVMIVRGLSPFLMVCKMMQNDAKCTRCVWSGKVTLRTDSNHTRLFVSWPWDLWKIRCPAQSHVPSSVQHQVQLLLTVRDVPGISAQGER